VFWHEQGEVTTTAYIAPPPPTHGCSTSSEVPTLDLSTTSTNESTQ